MHNFAWSSFSYYNQPQVRPPSICVEVLTHVQYSKLQLLTQLYKEPMQATSAHYGAVKTLRMDDHTVKGEQRQIVLQGTSRLVCATPHTEFLSTPTVEHWCCLIAKASTTDHIHTTQKSKLRLWTKVSCMLANQSGAAKFHLAHINSYITLMCS